MTKILIIDDFEDNLITLQALIQDLFPKTKVIKSTDGLTGIELAKSEQPDVILLDILMPGLNGFQVCQILKEDNTTNDIPVVFVTALKESTENRIKALKIGAEGFLTKPVDETELEAQIHAMLKIKEAVEYKKNEKARLEELVQKRTEELKEQYSVNFEMSKKLLDSEKRFQAAQEISPDGFTILHPLRNEKGQVVDFIWVYENKAIARINHTNPEEVKGKRLLELFPTHGESPVFEAYVKVANTGKTEILEEIYVGEIVNVPTWLRMVVVSMGKDIAILAQDITERKKTEEALIESEEKYRALYNNAPLAYQSLNADGLINDVNPAWLKVLGYERNEVIGKYFGNFLSPGFIPHFKKNFPLFKSQGYIHNMPFRLVRKDKSEIDVTYEGCIGYNKDGSFRQTYCTFKDITEEKKAKHELIFAKENAEKNQQLLSTITNNMSDVVWSCDLNFNIKYISPSVERVMGYSIETYLKRKVADKYPAQVIEKINKALQEEIKLDKEPGVDKNRNRIIEIQEFNAAGNLVDISANIKFTRDNEGNITGLIGVSRDITESKRIALELHASEKRFRQLFEKLPAAVYTFDREGYVHLWNKECEKIYGWTSSQAVGKTIFELMVKKENHAKVIENINTIFEGKSLYDNEFIDLSAEGKTTHVISNEYPLLDASGKVIFGLCAQIDITDRKKTEEALKENQRQLSTLMGNLPGMAYRCKMDKDWTMEFISNGCVQLTGYQPEDLINNNKHSYNDIIHPEFREYVYTSIIKALAQSKNFELEYKIISNHDTIKWVRELGCGIYSETGEIVALEGFITDITENKKTEDKLQAAATYWNKTFDALNDGMMILDRNQHVLQCNKKITEILGIHENDILNQKCHLLIHKTDCRIHGCPYARMETSLQRETMHLPIHDRIYEIVADPIIDSNGRIDGAVHILKDITEYERAKSEIEAHNTRLESLLKIARLTTNCVKTVLDETLDQAIRLTGSKYGYIFLYDEITQKLTLHSWSYEAMIQCNVKNVQLIYDLNKTGCWGEAIRRKAPFILNDYAAENTSKKGIPDGHVEIKKFLTIPVIRDHKIVGVIEVANKLTDYNNIDIQSLDLLADSAWKILERIEFQNNLTDAKNRAEESDRLKSAFLANMSHEIRTPMNGILGFLGILKKASLEESKKNHYIDIVNQSGERLLNTINDIIEVARIETGDVPITFSKIALQPFLNYYYTFFAPQAINKGLQLILQENELPIESFFCDENKLNSIFTNLIKNAIKFTDKGKITFGYTLKEENIEFFVNDTGIGIPANRQEAIFDRFVQADIEDQRAFQGSGLGLSIVKAYVEKLNGRIWLKSTENVGTTFFFSLPHKDEISKTTEDYNATTIRNNELPSLMKEKKHKILIVEDDEMSTLFIETILEEYNFNLITAHDGEEAINICRTNPDIALILMDIKIPIINGYESTRLIREFNTEVVIIAQTAYALSGDKEKALKAGCNDYISKPIEKDELNELIQKYLFAKKD